jgi:hypothetical protein
MGVLGKYGGNALKYYGSILASAYEHHNIADMWTNIRSAQEQYGLSKPGVSGPDVMVIRGYANRIVNGAKAFAAASKSDSITANMTAIAPYTARTLADIATNPIYHVRYKNTVQADDGSVTEVWNTSVFTAMDFPDTVGGLLDAIDTHAAELAAQGMDSSVTTPRGISIATSNHEITLV